MSETLPLFDYAALDHDTSVFLQQRATEVKALMRQSVENIIRTGNILIEVKGRLSHGQWLDWINSEFGWTPRTANRMMNVAETFRLENLSTLDIATSALYILSSPSTPDEAREEALLLAQQGQRINLAAAQDLRERHIGKVNDTKNKYQPFPETKPTDQQLLDLEAPQVPQPLITPPPPEFQKAETQAKPGKRQRLKKSPEQQTPALVIDKSLISSKAKTVEPGQTWRLGGFHILFCGDPTDPKFIKRLPLRTPLLLEFPPSRKRLAESFTDPFTSHFSFSTKLKDDFDLGIIREAVEITLEGTTDGGDGVVLYCLPDPAIFLLLEELDCIAYCAEPDPQKCNMAIAAWTTVTKRAVSRI